MVWQAETSSYISEIGGVFCMDKQINRTKIFATANKLIKKGHSRSEAFGMAWAKARKIRLFPFKYRCTMCGGTHEVTAKKFALVGIIDVALIALFILILTGQV